MQAIAGLLEMSVPAAVALLNFQLAWVSSCVFVLEGALSFLQPVPMVMKAAATRRREKNCFCISLDLEAKLLTNFCLFYGFLPELVPYFQPFRITANYLHSTNS
jgi:hypothetical protein